MFFWFDVIIIFVVLLFSADGYRQGVVKCILDILGIVISLFVALNYYSVAGTILVGWGLDPNLSKSVGFFALWFVMQLLFYLIIFLIFHYVPILTEDNATIRYLGIPAGFIKGLLTISIFLIIFMTLPFSADFKNRMGKSPISGRLLNATVNIQSKMSSIFNQLNNSLTLYSVAPQSDEVKKLGFKTNSFSISENGESDMIILINEDRKKVGLKPLKTDPLLRNVARAYAMQMLREGFFSHTTPEGQTPYDRLINANVNYDVAGENLALAPTVEIAHQGLMNSVTHRDNILDDQYTSIGVGVIDAGPYGIMIVQEFSG